MKKLFFASVALVALSAGNSVLAADMRAPVYKAPVVAPVPYYNWTGFYIGCHDPATT